MDRLLTAVHPVDRAAIRIWFHFYPLALQRAIDASDDPEALLRRFVMEGCWRLSDQVHTSHAFFYGHRYWRDVHRGVVEFVTSVDAPGSLDLSAQIQEIARGVAGRLNVDVSLLVGITAVAVRTLQQVGFDTFKTDPPPDTGAPARRESPEAVLAARARDDSQGLFGFLRGDRKEWTVTFDENDRSSRFPLINSQHITTAAALDTRDHAARDPRLTRGPIPVECRAASCGTCWVGVLGGAEKLSAVDPRERKTLAECGYASSDEERPIIRLSCMAQAFGAVSIVVPPWNGRFGPVAMARHARSGA